MEKREEEEMRECLSNSFCSVSFHGYSNFELACIHFNVKQVFVF